MLSMYKHWIMCSLKRHFAVLDSERPPITPECIKKIRRRGSEEPDKLYESVSCTSEDGDKADIDNSDEQHDFNEKEQRSSVSHYHSEHGDLMIEDAKEDSFVSLDYSSHIPCSVEFVVEELKHENPVAEMTDRVSEGTPVKRSLQRGSQSHADLRICHHNPGIKKCVSDFVVLNKYLNQDHEIKKPQTEDVSDSIGNVNISREHLRSNEEMTVQFEGTEDGADSICSFDSEDDTQQNEVRFLENKSTSETCFGDNYIPVTPKTSMSDPSLYLRSMKSSKVETRSSKQKISKTNICVRLRSWFCKKWKICFPCSSATPSDN